MKKRRLIRGNNYSVPVSFMACPEYALSLLEEPAAKLGYSAKRLAALLIEVAAEEGIVDAILDYDPGAGPLR